MSGYSDMFKDEQQRVWLNQWVPLDDDKLDDCPESFRDQYRFTLARARCAEAKVDGFTAFFRRMKTFVEA